MEEDNSIKDRMKNITTINFSITKCPHKVFEAFKELCSEETNDNYSMGLKILLDTKKANIKEVVLYQNYMEIKDELEQIKEKIYGNKEEEEKPKKQKTFGPQND